MTFSPLLPLTGVTGWNFLRSSLETQTMQYNQSPEIERSVAYFKENIRNIETLDELMGDRRILQVALGAFGLSEEINKGAYVRKVISEGTEDDSAFAVRLGNDEYLDLAQTFKTDSDGKMTISESDIERVSALYQRQSFEVEVGAQDDTMRLGLYFERKIGDHAGQGLSEDGGWYSLMGSSAMLEVIQGAFGAPSELVALDVSVQKDYYSAKSRALFGDGSIEALTDPDNVQTLIRQYMLREQLETGPSANTPGMAALSMLTATLAALALAQMVYSVSCCPIADTSASRLNVCSIVTSPDEPIKTSKES